MSVVFSIVLEVQKEIIRAQQWQIDAAQTVFDAGAQAIAAQQAAAKIAQANACTRVVRANIWGWM